MMCVAKLSQARKELVLFARGLGCAGILWPASAGSERALRPRQRGSCVALRDRTARGPQFRLPRGSDSDAGGYTAPLVLSPAQRRNCNGPSLAVVKGEKGQCAVPADCNHIGGVGQGGGRRCVVMLTRGTQKKKRGESGSVASRLERCLCFSCIALICHIAQLKRNSLLHAGQHRSKQSLRHCPSSKSVA